MPEIADTERDAQEDARWARYLLDLRRYVRSGRCLIGLGHAVRFFEDGAEGDEPELEASLSIDVVLRQSDGQLIASFSLSDEEIRFEEIASEHGPGGGERTTVLHGRYPSHTSIPFGELGPWRDLVADMLSGGAKMSVALND